MLRFMRLLLPLTLIMANALATVVQAASPTVLVLTGKAVINPVTADYINRGIREAENEKAAACIIQLDTPGGLDTSMRLNLYTNILSENYLLHPGNAIASLIFHCC